MQWLPWSSVGVAVWLWVAIKCNFTGMEGKQYKVNRDYEVLQISKYVLSI